MFKPSSTAADFTGLGVRRSPRPAGRSGCVTMPASFVRAATTRRLGTAKALVPKKSVFKPRVSSSLGGLFLLVAQRWTNVLRAIDVKLAVEMVHLVLQTLREQTFAFDANLL